jgi:colanic acid/amylovoran biosynthesis glycosyltransferase
MKIGYVINQYPKPSHSFIRREILALEARGNIVHRYALASTPVELVDPCDLAEQARTQHVFRQSPFYIATAFASIALAHPGGTLRALAASVHMGWRSDRGVLRHLAYLIEATVVASWCCRDEVQHLHAHFGTNSAALALLVHKLVCLPYSFTAHGPDEFDCPDFIALREKIRCASFVVAVSSFGRSQLMRWAEPNHWPKIKVVHCGLDDEFQTASGTPPSLEPRFVCVGRLAAQKGHLLLIDAVHRLHDEGLTFELVLVGDGPLRGILEQRIAAVGLQEQVRITGWLTGAQVRDELKRARALVLPSFAEGLPVVIMEAMAMQRPVIATYVAGIPELVVPGKTGWLIPAGDEVALTEAMRAALLADPDEIVQMGETGRGRVLERHNISGEVEKLESFMRSPAERQKSC